MRILMCGLDHASAGLAVRERFAFGDAALDAALAALAAQPDVLEAAVLSTCNRTELYAVVTSEEAGRAALLDFALTAGGEAARHLRFRVEAAAVEHLFRVAAGLESQILGEGQILAQVKAALAISQQCDAAGQYLEMLFQQAIKAGKQVRTETNIGRGSVSVSSAAVEVACKQLGDLRDRIVLIYGAGKMSSHTIKALFQRGARHVYIVNRTLERAQEAANRLGGEAVSMEAGRMLHAVADVIICCTSAPHYLIGPENYPRVPGNRQRLLIDIAVPRNIDPALAEMPGVHVIDLDGLEAVARSNRAERESQIIDAEVMIEKNLADFTSRLASFQTVPTIQAFTGAMEALATDELEDFLERNGGLLERDPRAALERFKQLLVARLMHPPIVRLKTLDADEQVGHAAALARLFDLEVEDATQRYLRKRLPQREKALQAGELARE